jgi:hypothetical protein
MSRRPSPVPARRHQPAALGTLPSAYNTQYVKLDNVPYPFQVNSLRIRARLLPRGTSSLVRYRGVTLTDCRVTAELVAG